MKYKIRILTKEDSIPLGLLLQADPNKDRVNSYCKRNTLLVVETKDGTLGVCVVEINSSKKSAEILNLSILDSFQGEGYGKKMIESVVQFAAEQNCESIIVGTGNSSINQIAFYQKCGFRMFRIEKDWFLKEYNNAIFENGIQCVDRILFEKKLTL